jgi:transposase InsO family protein
MTNNIVRRFGIPHRIQSDNGTNFKNKKIYKFAEKYKINWQYSTAYNPAANGLAEAFNKTLCNLLAKILEREKMDWHDRVYDAVWAYRTTYKTPTGCTPYSLVYGTEAAART